MYGYIAYLIAIVAVLVAINWVITHLPLVLAVLFIAGTVAIATKALRMW